MPIAMNASKLLSLLVIAASLVACGGGGGGGSSTPSTYQGVWSGTWTADNSDTGTASLSINSGGNVTGTTHDTTQNADGTVSGHITENGDITGTVHYQNTSPYSVTGQLGLLPNQTTLTGAITGNGVVTTFTLEKQ